MVGNLASTLVEQLRNAQVVLADLTDRISRIRKSLENGGDVEIGGRVAQRIFGVAELAAAGLETEVEASV